MTESLISHPGISSLSASSHHTPYSYSVDRRVSLPRYLLYTRYIDAILHSSINYTTQITPSHTNGRHYSACHSSIRSGQFDHVECLTLLSIFCITPSSF